MSEKTRVRLGAYFLFALLVLTLPVTLLVARYDAISKTPRWRAGATGMEYVAAGQREKALDFAQKLYGVSRSGAERALAQRERETGLRVGNGQTVPYGAQIDYYTVDGKSVPNKAKFVGSATVVSPASAPGQEYLNSVRRQARLDREPKYVQSLEAMLKKNFLLIPASWGLSQPAGVASDIGKANVKALTTNLRIAVVCTVLPGFRDISPRSNGNTDPNDGSSLSVNYTDGAASATPAEVCYRQSPYILPSPPGLLYNYADWDDTPKGTDERYHISDLVDFATYGRTYWGSIFDSPGGVFNTGGNWGIPYGVSTTPAGGWDYTQEALFPAPEHATNLLLQNDMFDLFYDEAFGAASCSNWFYQQTHGAVKITGVPNDINGWLRSAHQTNRYPYQIGGGNAEFVFPGTPVIRTGRGGTSTPVSGGGYSPATPNVIRATLSSRGCTILFSQPASLPTDITALGGTVAINAYTSADVSEGAATSGGNVDIVWGQSAGSVIMDPYDNRRWTITNPGGNSWKFQQSDDTSPVSPTYVAFVATSNRAWTLNVTGWPLLGGTMATVARNQMMGCPDLQNTAIVDADMPISMWDHRKLASDSAGYPAWERDGAPGDYDDPDNTSRGFDQRPFARLKSQYYYTHSYSGNGAYQISHLNNEWDQPDDISGSSVRTTVARVYPYDTGPNDTHNGGYWGTGATVREGSSFDYAGDVNNVLRDNGILAWRTADNRFETFADKGYAYTVYIDADGVSGSAGGSDDARNGRGFQASSSLTNIDESASGVVFHELCHAITQVGGVDLYDNDLYANNTVPRPNPLYQQCRAMGPYSIQASGGRMDAWHLERKLASWGLSPVQAITQDRLGVSLPQVESMLRDPVIIKMPANPYYIKEYLANPLVNTADTWDEYFLIENRNTNSSDTNGAYSFDSSTKGVYIYHIDNRGPARNNPNHNSPATSGMGGQFWQRENDLLGVIVEQADGYHDQEYTLVGANPASGLTWAQTWARDPFGADTASRVTRFWQFPMFNGDVNDASQAIPDLTLFAGGSPTSYSHGYTYKERDGGSGTNVIIPGTETDSFSRIVKISAVTAQGTRTADCYVEPAELVPTLTNSAASLVTKLTAGIQSVVRGAAVGGVNTVTVTTTAAHGFNCGESVAVSGTTDGTINGVYPIQVDPLQPTQFTFTQNNQAGVSLGAGGQADSGITQQGEQNVGFLKLVLENPDGRNGAGLTDYRKMSIKDVYIEKLYVLNSGTGTSPSDIAQAKLFVDSNANNRFEPANDTLLGTAALETSGTYLKHAIFGKTSGMGYRIPLGETKTFFVAYDLAAEAQINPHITAGAEFTDARKLEPRLPGTVQVRKRNNAPYDFGTSNFPIFSNTATIVGFPDKLLVTRDLTNIPTKASQGQVDVPVVKLTAAVNPANSPRAGGSVRVDSIKVDQVGTMDAVSDLVNCKLYLDNGDGSFDKTADGAWTMAQLGLTAVPTSSFTPAAGTQGRANFPNLNMSVPSPLGANRVMFLTCSVAAGADRTKNLKLRLDFPAPGPGPQPQNDCYIQLINNPTEDNSNKDYVAYVAPEAVWPLDSQALSIIKPNTAPSAPPDPPAGSFSPSGGQQISNRRPKLTWTAGDDPDLGSAGPPVIPDDRDALKYEVQIAKDATTQNDFASLADSTITGVGELTWPLTTDLDLNQNYGWRVRTIDQWDAPSPWSTVQTFRVVDNRAPEVITAGFMVKNLPADATGFTSPPTPLPITTLTPTLVWNKTTDPDTAPANPDTTLKYLLQIDDNSDFSSPVALTSIGAAAPQWSAFGACADTTVTGNVGTSFADQNSYTVVVGDGLTKGTTYYWHVAAIDGASLASAWSATQSFKPQDDQAPYAPDRSFVPTGAVEITSARPVLSWDMPAPPDPDVTDTLPLIHYEVQLKRGDGDFSNGTITNWPTADDVRQWAIGTDLAPPDNGHYYWRVRAVDDQNGATGLAGAWSTVQDFWVNTANDAPDPPTDWWDPTNDATTNDATPTLSWDNSVDPDVDPYDGAFTTGAAPTQTVGVSWIAELTWTPLAGPVPTYNPDGSFATPQYSYPVGALAAAGRPSVTCTTPLTQNVYWYWHVQAVDNDGARSTWSLAQRFIVDTDLNPPTAPTGLVPATGDSVSGSNPRLSWNAATDTEDAPGALRYEVVLATDAAFTTGTYYNMTPAGQTWDDGLSGLVAGPTYFWHARTVDTSNMRSAWSATQSFTVVTNRAPNQITAGFDPPNSGTTSDRTPILSWDAAAPADPDVDDTAANMQYRLQVDDENTFGTPQTYAASPLVSPPYADPTHVSHTVPVALNVGGTYYWRVMAVDSKGMWGTWSPTQSFRVIANQAPTAPAAGFDPSDGEEISTGTPHIIWNAGTDPNSNDTAATLRYEIQVKADPDVSTGPYAFTKTTGKGENWADVPAPSALQDDLHYYYRVRTIDQSDLSSPWSASGVTHFWVNTVNDVPREPSSGFVPPAGATVNTRTPTLSWDNSVDPDDDPFDGNVTAAPVVGVHFEVQLSRDATFTTVAYTYTTAAGVSQVTPAALTDGVTWNWRVRTVDDDGASSPWTAGMAFNVNTLNAPPNPPATGFNPAGGRNVSDLTPTLSWDPASDPDVLDTPDTLHYEVELCSDAAFPSPVPVGTYFYSTPTADGVTNTTVPNGQPLSNGVRYYWRVRTVDSSNTRSASWSGVQNFIVGTNQPPTAPTSGFWPSGPPARGLSISDRTPTMQWNAGADPDANDTTDNLRYNMQVDDNNDFSSPIFASTTAFGQTTANCTPPGGLAEGAVYYWRIQTQDAAGALSGWSATQIFNIIANRQPSAPIAAFTPAAWPPINTANPTLTWNMPTPPDPDPNDTIDQIRWEVQLKDASDLANGPYIFTATNLTAMQVSCTVNLLDNEQYWWRVRAFDSANLASDWSAIQTFWVNLVNQAPLPPDVFDPANGVQISDDTPLLQWNDGTDADPDDPANTLTYIVELSSDNFTTTSYQYSTSGSPGTTQVTPTVPLTDLTTWYWRVRTVDNSGAQSAWSTIQNFDLDKGNQQPVLSVDDGTPAALATFHVQPLYGALATTYQLYVTYTDAENDLPTWVRCTFDTGLTKDMRKVNAGDSDATNGILYVVGVTGNELGLGAHGHVFSCDAGTRLPATLGDSLRGPIVGSASQLRLIDINAVDQTTYEEGSLVWIWVSDADENSSPTTRQTIQVTVTGAAGDSEVVTLTESDVNTGRFAGSVRALGRLGADNDGSLNTVAGATGQQITATYTDQDDIVAPANATPDVRSDTATVVDTTAPAAIGAALTMVSGIHGRSIDLDWTTYNEAGQVDVAGYHVWIATTQFGDTTAAGLTPIATLPAGTRTCTVSELVPGTGLIPNRQYWLAVSAFDEVPLELTRPGSQSLTTRDTTPPEVRPGSQNPAPGTTEVALVTPISFTLDDPGVGVNDSTLRVHLYQNGTLVQPDPAAVTPGGDKYVRTVTVAHAPFQWNATVAVVVDVTDADGNQLLLSQTDWTFDTVTDRVLPTLDELVPAANATNVPVSTNISFALHDTGSGINIAATTLEFGTTPATLAAVTLLPTDFAVLPDGVRVTYNPPADLLYNTQYTVRARGADNAGNQTALTTWTFNTVVDSGDVTVDQFDPARDAVDVPINTNVSFRMSDPLAGIVASTFRLWVAGTEVTGTPGVTIIQVPAVSDHPNTMAVSYNPPTDFPYGTDINVRIYAEDRVGNVTDLPYKFTTVDAPTYNISGIITDGAAPTPRPIAGVTVTIPGHTPVQTDGNGAYRILGLLAGNYTATPTKAEYVFTPVNANATVGPDDAVLNFTGRLLTYSLSGVITEQTIGGAQAVAAVQVACNGLTATTDANGAYTIAGLPNGTYTVTPTKTNYHFLPPAQAAQIASADRTGVNFEAVADTFQVQGTVTDNTGARVEGAAVECGGKNAVTDAAGQYLITGLRAGNYTVTPTKAGYLMSPLNRAVTVPPSRTAVDFVANIEIVANFPAGTNLIGVPGTPIDTNPMNVFGINALRGEGVYRWNPALVPPRYLVGQNEPTAEALQVKPGRGFFVVFNGARQLRIPGVPTSAVGTTSIGLSEGWNMIANPRSMPLKFNRFVPSVPSGIRPFAFVYDNTLGSYLMVSSDPSLGATRDTVLGWEGAWIRATSGGVSLLVSGPSTAATKDAMKPQQADLNGGWMVPVTARAGNRADVSSVAAVVPGGGEQHSIENPPTAPDTVDVYFTDGAGARLAHDVRSTSGPQTFTFVVACDVPDADVTVSLPDLSSVPADLQVVLTDKESGKTLYGRTMQGYTYHSNGARSERTFELLVSPRTIGALSVSAVAQQAAGGNVALTYTVTKACAVSVKVLNIAGRCVRELVTEKPVTAGVQNELWNLCSATGTRVPAGTYLLQIEAVTDSGQRVRSMAQVRVNR